MSIHMCLASVANQVTPHGDLSGDGRWIPKESEEVAA